MAGLTAHDRQLSVLVADLLAARVVRSEEWRSSLTLVYDWYKDTLEQL